MWIARNTPTETMLPNQGEIAVRHSSIAGTKREAGRPMRFPSAERDGSFASRLLEKPRVLVVALLLAAAAACSQEVVDGDDDSSAIEISAGTQGWSEADAKFFHHATQGTRLLPLSWLVSLEQATSDEPFLSPDYLHTLGLIADPSDPDGLPIGVARLEEPGDGTFVGLTCAACHTTEFKSKSGTVRIEGGGGQVDVVGFGRAVEGALAAVVASKIDPANLFDSSSKGKRFAAKVDAYEAAHGATSLAARIERRTALTGGWFAFHLAKTHGYGREDASGITINTIGPELSLSNFTNDDAAVSIPSIWDTSRYDWHHVTGSSTQPLARNMFEAMAAGPRIHVPLTDWIAHLAKTFNTRALGKIHETVSRLGPPTWPNEFAPIDAPMANRGQTIYGERCASCHPIIQPGNDTISLKLIPIETVGTDPAAIGHLSEIADSGGLGYGKLPWFELGKRVTDDLIADATKADGLTTSELAQMTAGRENVWRTPNGYVARPLRGIWATPPYLHNGSVPTLDALLRPDSQRPQVFSIGPDCLYDDLNVGFAPNCTTGSPVDTSHPGDRNIGHTGSAYGTDLPDGDRAALIEYLKTL